MCGAPPDHHESRASDRPRRAAPSRRAAARSGGGAARARRCRSRGVPARGRAPRAAVLSGAAAEALQVDGPERARDRPPAAQPLVRASGGGGDAEQAVAAGAEEPAVPRPARDRLGELATSARGAGAAPGGCARIARAGEHVIARVPGVDDVEAALGAELAQPRDVAAVAQRAYAARRARSRRADESPRARACPHSDGSLPGGAGAQTSETSCPASRCAAASASIGAAGPVHFQSLESWRILTRGWRPHVRRRSTDMMPLILPDLLHHRVERVHVGDPEVEASARRAVRVGRDPRGADVDARRRRSSS